MLPDFHILQNNLHTYFNLMAIAFKSSNQKSGRVYSYAPECSYKIKYTIQEANFQNW